MWESKPRIEKPNFIKNICYTTGDMYCKIGLLFKMVA